MGRLGSFRRTRRNLSAFHAAPISAGVDLTVDSELLRLLDEASRAVGRLDGATQLLPNPEHFAYMYLRLEAIVSSKIEGTQASLMDLLQYEQERLDHDRTDDLNQVANHLGLLRGLRDRQRQRPLTLQEVETLHADLLSGARGGSMAGGLRSLQNWIGPTGGPIEAAVFVPPPPEEVPMAMEDLVGFVSTEKELPPLLHAAIAHAQFETIHPFVDGNGRLGRYLIHFILWQRGVIDRPLLYLSHYFRSHQAEYYQRLQATRTDDDLEGWCRFFLTGVRLVAQEATERARGVLDVQREIERRVRERLGYRSGRALAVVGQMYQTPICRVAEIAAWTGSSVSAANALAAAMERSGVLREVTGHRRNRAFALAKYLDMFTAVEAR